MISIAESTMIVPVLRFPELHIVAPLTLPGSATKAFYAARLESMPATYFNAWLRDIAAAEQLAEVPVLGVDSIAARWQCVNDLAEAGVDMEQYLHENIDDVLLFLVREENGDGNAINEAAEIGDRSMNKKDNEGR